MLFRSVHHRRVDWTGDGGDETVGLCVEFFEDDVPASVDAGDSVGADL